MIHENENAQDSLNRPKPLSQALKAKVKLPVQGWQ
jgi:hypothetical protein